MQTTTTFRERCQFWLTWFSILEQAKIMKLWFSKRKENWINRSAKSCKNTKKCSVDDLQQVMLSCRMFAGGGLRHLATSVLHWFHGETTRKLHLYLLMDLSTMCLNDTLAALQLLGSFSPWHFPKEKIAAKPLRFLWLFVAVLHQTLRGGFAGFLQLPQLLHMGHVLFIHLEINRGNHWTISLKNSSCDHLSHRFESGVGEWGESWILKQWIHQSNTLKKETRFSPSLAPAMSKLLTFFSSSWCTDICSSSSWRTVWAKFQGEKRHKLHSYSWKRGQISKQSKANLGKNLTSKLPDTFFKCNFKTNMLITYFLDLPFQKKKRLLSFGSSTMEFFWSSWISTPCFSTFKFISSALRDWNKSLKENDTRRVSSFFFANWCLLKL